MSVLMTAIVIVWAAFWVYWLISARDVKEGTRSVRSRFPGGVVLLLAFVLVRVLRPGSLAVHLPALQVLGAIVFVSGLAVAVWARVRLGRNWGMPMTEKAEPELVTSGPYRWVRHPIYSGILLAMVGTALATNLDWLIIAGLLGAYFLYSATVEERRLAGIFPTAYASYRSHTKMLIPFVV